MAQYWTPYHQQLIRDYYYAYTGTTSGETRNRIVTQLMPVLEYIVRTAIRNAHLEVNDENVQVMTIRMYEYILPKLDEQRIQAALHYLYKSTIRYCYNINSLKKYPHLEISDLEISDDEDLTSSITDTPEYYLNKEDMRKEIIMALDEKIEEQQVINKTTTIFLISMKEYLLANDFDPSGFRDYIMDKMNICKSTYTSIISRCGIKSKPFNTQIIKE